MIDKLHIFLALANLPKNYHYFLWNKIATVQYRENGYNEEKSITGRWNGISVSLNRVGFTIKFNPTKYILGDNLGMLKFEEVKKAVELVSEEFNINLFTGKVIRLDIAANILTKYPSQEYMDLLFSSRYFKRVQLGTSLYFKNTRRTIIIYDKTKEMRKKGFQCNAIFKGKNILRYEYRFLNGSALAAFFKMKTVTVLDVLCSWVKLVDEWIKFFLEIRKTQEPLMFKEEAWINRGEIDRQLKIHAINSMGGLEAVHNIIDYAKLRGYFKKYQSQASHLKAKFSKWMNHPSMFEPSKKTLEVEIKFKRLGELCKSEFYVFS